MEEINVKQLESRIITNSPQNISKGNVNVENKNFQHILERIKANQEEIKFSKHALERMDGRKIELSTDETDKLNKAVEKAEKKGVKDALILMGDKAFIASIKNRTIITTVDREGLRDNVFTNIDGAVII
jgi:flagellar operon protein